MFTCQITGGLSMFCFTQSACAAGVLPIGRVSAAAQQAKAPFHNLDVSLGQYELSTAVLHQAPSLQVPYPPVNT